MVPAQGMGKALAAGLFALASSLMFLFVVSNQFEPNVRTASLTQALSARQTITDLTIGAGERAKNGDRVLVHYTARLENNTVFDSTRQRGQPLEVVVGSNAVVGGWDSGLAGMRIGGKRTITIPAARVKTSGLPFSSALTIEVDLLAIKQ